MTLISHSLDEALHCLTSEDCIGLPTETVYGLAGAVYSDKAVAKIYRVKNRPATNPLILHVCDEAMALEYGVFSAHAQTLMDYFWQYKKPLTFVVPRRHDAPPMAAHLINDTVAIRCPAHPLALSLIRAFQRPLVAPSANRSQYISPTTCEAVYQDLKDHIPLILDGGPCKGGIESTIISVIEDEVTLLRPGMVSAEELRTLIPNLQIYKGYASLSNSSEPSLAPGLSPKHYAPHKPLTINVTHNNDPQTAFLGFGADPHHQFTANLSLTGNLNEAAQNLYALLRQLDQDDRFERIAVFPIPLYDLGYSLNDRLSRAAYH